MAGTEHCWYHRRVGIVIVATHFGRHYCPACQRHDVLALCDQCTKNYRVYVERFGNYDWSCETCGSTMERRVLGKVTSE